MSKRVAPSVIGEKFYELTERLYVSCTISKDLSIVFGVRVILCLFTDSKKRFNINTRCKTPTEKQLEIGSIATLEAYQNYVIFRAGLVHGKKNPVDRLTTLNSKLLTAQRRGSH